MCEPGLSPAAPTTACCLPVIPCSWQVQALRHRDQQHHGLPSRNLQPCDQHGNDAESTRIPLQAGCLWQASHPKALDMLCKQATPECRLAAILQVVCCSCCSSRLSSCLLICFTCAFYSRTGLATLTCALITTAEQAPLTSWTRAAAVVCSATSLACSSRSLLVTC